MRKSLLVMAAVWLALFSVTAHNSQPSQIARTEWRKINPVTPLTTTSFARPPATDWPWVRMNIPGTADPAEIKAEVKQLHDSGIAGIEIGQGAYPNNKQLVALLSAASQLGVKVSLSHGPTISPVGYSIDAEHARKSLFVGKTAVNAGATFQGAVPPPAQTQGSRSGFGLAPPRGAAPNAAPAGPPPNRGPQAKRATLVAVLAYRCTKTPCAPTGPVELDRASVVDLTATITGKNKDGYIGGTTAGELQWTAPATPANAQWLVIGVWARGVFPQPDPFSDEGYGELINGLESELSVEVKKLLQANGGDIFIDSHSVDRGSPDELWTNKMADEFSRRRNYPLTPNLPALFREQFDFNDGSAPRVREDFYAVRGDIWLEKQIAPLRQWVRKYNNILRVQVEGEANLTIPITDMVQATAAVDRPEHENLFVGDEIDNYLPMASANHMTGNSWYSTECCAVLNKNYAQTFQDAVIKMHRSFIGGITKLVYHVYPYRDAATAKWPGYHNFGQAGFSNAWGPRNPYWADAKLYNDYIARNQQVLTQGDAKTDVAVYFHNYLYPPSQSIKMRHWGDARLQEAGYTRDYLNPTMLELPNAVVKEKRLAPDGPAYNALIIDSEQGPSTDPVKTAMPVEVARKILGYARAGLPIIVVGTPPNRTPGNAPKDDETLKGLIGQLLAERSVSRVAHESDVPEKLRALGIRPAAEPAQPSSLLSIRRRDDATKTDYYFFYNQGVMSPPDEPTTLFEPATGEPVEREISLEGRGQPYLLDAWSGKITPIVQYQRNGDRVTLRLKLARDNGVLIALSETPNRFGGAAPTVNVAQTNADEAVIASNAIVIRATKAGDYSTKLGNGRTVNSRITAVPAALDLTKANWALKVEDWQPVNPYATTFGVAATQTQKLFSELALPELKAWPDIPALQHASGIGVYTTSFELPANWAKAHGARLSLGEVFDTFVVTVNGTPVSIDQISADVDIGAALKPGRNTLTVRVATTLNNRLSKLDEDVVRRKIVQPYGLIGPVVLTPYGQATVWQTK